MDGYIADESTQLDLRTRFLSWNGSIWWAILTNYLHAWATFGLYIRRTTSTRSFSSNELICFRCCFGSIAVVWSSKEVSRFRLIGFGWSWVKFVRYAYSFPFMMYWFIRSTIGNGFKKPKNGFLKGIFQSSSAHHRTNGEGGMRLSFGLIC